MERRRSTILRVLLVLSLVVLGSFVVACAEDAEDEAAEPGAEPGVEEPLEEATEEPVEEATEPPTVEATEAPAEEVEPTAATLEEINDNPTAFLGQSVTVEGGIDEVLSERAFTIASETLTEENEFLVVNASEEALDVALETEQPVRVTGQVVEFVIADVEQEFDLDLDDELVVEFEGQPAIIATNVEVIEEVAEEAEPIETTPEEVVADPGAFEGRPISMAGPVSTVLNDQAFTLVAGGDSFLVLNNTGEALDLALSPGDTVDVLGEIVRFDVATVEDEFGMDVDDDIEDDLTESENQAVLVAEAIEITEDVTAEEEPTDEAATATLEEITDNPESFVGQTVTVDGGVNVVLGPTAFTIASDTLTDDDETLVINATGQALETALEAEQPVRVTGQVIEFSRAAAEAEAGVTFEDDVATDVEDFEGRPAIVAQNVEVIEDAEDAEADDETVGVEGEEDTLGQITDNPQSFIGQQVTATGAVNVVVNERAFSIANNTFTDDDEILVIDASEETLDRALAVEEPVRVTGQVVEFNVADVENEFGIDLDDDVFADVEGRPAIVAENVEVLGGAVTLDDITDDPQAYVGRSVTVSGGIDEVRTERAFTIASSTLFDLNEILVINASEEALDVALAEDQPVRVRGQVVEFVTVEIEEEFGIDLDDEVVAEFEGQPAIVAQNVSVIEETDEDLNTD